MFTQRSQSILRKERKELIINIKNFAFSAFYLASLRENGTFKKTLHYATPHSANATYGVIHIFVPSGLSGIFIIFNSSFFIFSQSIPDKEANYYCVHCQ